MANAMMIPDFYNNLTRSQIFGPIISVAILAFIIGILGYYVSKNNKVLILVILSFFVEFVLFNALVYVTSIISQNSIYFSFINEEVYAYTLLLIGIAFSTFVNLYNLLVLIRKYSLEAFQKDMDPDHITRYHFQSTINTFVLILLLFGAVIPFIQNTFITVITIIFLTTSISIFFNHFLSRLFIKDIKN